MYPEITYTSLIDGLVFTKIKINKNKKALPASHFFAFSDDKLVFFFTGLSRQQYIGTD